MGSFLYFIKILLFLKISYFLYFIKILLFLKIPLSFKFKKDLLYRRSVPDLLDPDLPSLMHSLFDHPRQILSASQLDLLHPRLPVKILPLVNFSNIMKFLSIY